MPGAPVMFVKSSVGYLWLKSWKYLWYLFDKMYINLPISLLLNVLYFIWYLRLVIGIYSGSWVLLSTTKIISSSDPWLSCCNFHQQKPIIDQLFGWWFGT